MKASRITAVGLVAAATLWIASGHLLPRDSGEGHAAIRTAETEAQPPFRVSVITANVMSSRTVRRWHCPAGPRPTGKSP